MIGPSVLRRGDFIADLQKAVDPAASRSVLVVFGFKGLHDHLEASGVFGGDELLNRLESRLAQTVRGAGKLYAPRRGELCALFANELMPVWPMVPAALDEELSMLGIRTTFALVVLPEEASTTTGALLLADHRLRAQAGNLRPRR